MWMFAADLKKESLVEKESLVPFNRSQPQVDLKSRPSAKTSPSQPPRNSLSISQNIVGRHHAQPTKQPRRRQTRPRPLRSRQRQTAPLAPRALRLSDQNFAIATTKVSMSALRSAQNLARQACRDARPCVSPVFCPARSDTFLVVHTNVRPSAIHKFG